MNTLEAVKLYLGFDVGGEGGEGGSHRADGCRGHFGWSICCEGGDGNLERICTGLARHARDAVAQVKDEIEARYREDNFHVVAAGIDAPLLWNKRGDRQGYRKAEDDLATALEAIGRRPPTAAYRLPGEVTMQGPLIAWYLGAEWNVAITESYPRVFRQLLEYINRCDLLHTADRLMQGLTPSSRRPEECEHGHEQDATLLAMAAWAAIQNPPLPNWQNLYDGDDCLFNPSGVPVSYWMPIPATNQPH